LDIPSHPNILPVLTVRWRSKPYILTMPFCEEGDLKKYILKTHVRPKELLRILQQVMKAYFLRCIIQEHLQYVQVVEGLQHLHSHRLTHRDIKPENILIKKVSIGNLANWNLR